MAKKQEKAKDNSSAVEPAAHAGKVKGIRASETALRFDLEGKKGKLITLSLETRLSHLVTVLVAAYGSGKKLHVALSPSGTVTELRFGAAPKAKPAKAKPVTIVKTIAEQSAATAASAEK